MQGNYLLCFGSEGGGLDGEIVDLADQMITVHKSDKLQTFPNSLLDSLNVSVACALLVEKHLSQFKGK